MFYCLFDLIEQVRKEKGESTEQMLAFFRRRKVTKGDLMNLSQNCALEEAKAVMPAVCEYAGLSELAVWLSLGVVPEEYKDSFRRNAGAIASIVEPGMAEKPAKKALKPFFSTGSGTLYNADCLDVLAGMEDGSVDLIFADPPFNLDKVYDDGINDNLSMSGYLQWCYKWIGECCRVLKPGGSLFIYNIPKWGSYFAEFLNRRLTFRSWIGVDMKFNLPLAGRLYPAHYSLLYYVKGEKPKAYHPQRIPLQTCRHCGGEIKDYGGYKSKMNPEGVNVSDIWTDIYPVRHKGQKNRSYNELSVKFLDRVISMASDPGDLVFDPFGGSGTTYVVAELLGRRWIGSELGNCTVISDRFGHIERDRALLEKVQAEKNVLFTEETKEIRKKNGFWLAEDFHPGETDGDPE